MKIIIQSFFWLRNPLESKTGFCTSICNRIERVGKNLSLLSHLRKLFLMAMYTFDNGENPNLLSKKMVNSQCPSSMLLKPIIFYLLDLGMVLVQQPTELEWLTAKKELM
ncbi:hypothetical protein [Emticicia fluvialis]|uniref:hypothetical protein n=1 Tax=Emticicia fluvialis TaxID=2974474 RepID=UPI00216611FE|nr:hypothetical protein [Emticicia fluvialis]